MKFDLKFVSLLLITSLLFLSLPHSANAQIDATGFIRNYNAVKTVPDHQILVGRNRFRFDLNRPFSMGEIRVSNELQNLYNRGIDSLEYRLREAYAELYFPNSDLRVGKQIISWGRTDGAFIADILSPVDLSEFLTQDFADLKTGLNAISYTRYFGQNYLQIILNPVFQPNEIPEPGSRWFPRIFADQNFETEFRSYNPDPILKNAQFGGRLALRSNLNYDLDLGVLYWHYPNPAYYKDLNTGFAVEPTLVFEETYTQSLVFLYSGTLRLTERLLFKSEASYHTSRTFDYLTPEIKALGLENPTFFEQLQLIQNFNENSDGFLKESPWLIAMAGLDYTLGEWIMVAQIIDEYIVDYDRQILQQEHYTYATLLLQRSFFRNKFAFRGFGRYNFAGDDFWVNPEVTYTGIDNIEASVGAQLFGGPEPEQWYGHLSFNTYRSNSFAYLQFTAYF